MTRAMRSKSILLAVDPSLRHTGYALLEVDSLRERITILHTDVADNRNYHAPYGCLLDRIHRKTLELAQYADAFAREGQLIMEVDDTVPVMHKVFGVMDMALWQAKQDTFCDIPVGRIKRLVADDEYARKRAVLRSLCRYVGPYSYGSYDESDAVAVGIAYLKVHTNLNLPRVCERRRQQNLLLAYEGGLLHDNASIAFG